MSIPSNLSQNSPAFAIWKAAVDAVDSTRLVQSSVTASSDVLNIAGEQFGINDVDRLVVVGAGKAGAGMAKGFENALPDVWFEQTSGWINVPADCVRDLQRIHLHPARPAGVNEPTAEGVAGAQEILTRVSQLTPRDVCVVLLSGGGSALLPAPVDAISLADKQAVTRLLMLRGASIDELNCVRTQLSRIKGGGLARACRAGTLLALIISDVIGDPLDVIASGPTVPTDSNPQRALQILNEYAPSRADIPGSVSRYLQERVERGAAPASTPTIRCENHIIGSNTIALQAAAHAARERGYRVESLGSDNRGVAREVGVQLARRAEMLRDASNEPVCLLSGGEPIVELAETDQPRRGGRNQELVLAALEYFWDRDMSRITVLSGGTDGEDGPTDAAGAVADLPLLNRVRGAGLHPGPYLAINDSYTYFAQCGGLIRTGPTHTNVMDIRVVLVDPPV